MELNQVKGYGEIKKRLNYKHILLLIVIIIIFLLLIIIKIVKTNTKNEEENVQNNQEISEQEDVMIFEIEEDKVQLKAEEENATGIIYLTFDDGPSSDSTPQILDILEKRNIKATFFVLHYSEENEKYIKREQDQGHTIGLHGYTHEYSQIYQSADMCIENFNKIREQVYQTTGVLSNILRFPGGSSNTISRKYCEGVMTELTNRLEQAGFKYFDWNVDSDDAGHAKTSDDIYRNVTRGLEPGRSNVVLMHDFGGNHKTINALEGIINYGLDNGYVFRRITDDIPMVRHDVNN